MQYAINNGIIDISTVQTDVDMKKREHYLSLHEYEVWEGKNGNWYTYLPCDIKGRVLKKRSTEDKIKDVIINFYREKESRPLFEDVFTMWLNEKLELNEICKGTYDRYLLDYLRFFSKSEINNVMFDEITEDMLEVFIRRVIVENKLTQKAYSNFRLLLYGVFKYAKKKKFTTISITHFMGDLDISRNSFIKIVKNKEDQVYLEDEIPLVIAYLKENISVLNLGLLLTFQTGIRTGELAALKFTDVKGKTIHVQRQEIKFKDPTSNRCVHEIKEFPKTDAGNRYIIITDSTLETINAIKKLNPHGNFMFENNGKRILTNSYNDGIGKMCKALGINRKSMHKIRKTYGTTLIDANVDDSIIMEQMGHSDITTTKKFYYFSNKNQKSKEMQIQKAINI